MDPEEGGNMPISILMIVVFPAPLCPNKQNISPSFMLRSTSSTAFNPPNLLLSLFNFTAGAFP